MIFDSLINLYFDFIDWIISITPSGVELPETYYNMIDYINGLINNLVYFAPWFGELLVVLSLIISIEIAIQTFYAIVWVYKKLPFT